MAEMTPLERAARALYRTDDFDPHQFGEDRLWPDLVDYVRLVLHAIREPSEAMLDAGSEIVRSVRQAESDFAVQDDAKSAWRSMIDAALEEG